MNVSEESITIVSDVSLWSLLLADLDLFLAFAVLATESDDRCDSARRAALRPRLTTVVPEPALAAPQWNTQTWK